MKIKIRATWPWSEINYWKKSSETYKDSFHGAMEEVNEALSKISEHSRRICQRSTELVKINSAISDFAQTIALYKVTIKADSQCYVTNIDCGMSCSYKVSFRPVLTSSPDEADKPRSDKYPYEYDWSKNNCRVLNPIRHAEIVELAKMLKGNWGWDHNNCCLINEYRKLDLAELVSDIKSVEAELQGHLNRYLEIKHLKDIADKTGVVESESKPVKGPD